MPSPLATRKAELQALRAQHAAARLEHPSHTDRGIEDLEPRQHWARPVHVQRCFAEALHGEQMQNALATSLPGSSFEERLPAPMGRRRVELPRAEAPILGFESGPLKTSRTQAPSPKSARQQQRQDLEQAFAMLGGRLEVVGFDEVPCLEEPYRRTSRTAPAPQLGFDEFRGSTTARSAPVEADGDRPNSSNPAALTPSIDGQRMAWARGLAQKSPEELEAELPDLLEAARERSRLVHMPSLHSTAPMLAAANDHHWEVRLAVLRALARLPLAVHLEALAVVCLALHDRSAAVRDEAKVVFRRSRQPRALAQPLLSFVESSDIPKLRRGAAEGLSLLGLGASGAVEAAAQTSLAHALKDPRSKEIRNTTARAFRETACPRNALASPQERIEGSAPKAHEKPREQHWSRAAAERFMAPGMSEMPPYSWHSRISENRARRKGWTS